MASVRVGNEAFESGTIRMAYAGISNRAAEGNKEENARGSGIAKPVKRLRFLAEISA